VSCTDSSIELSQFSYICNQVTDLSVDSMYYVITRYGEGLAYYEPEALEWKINIVAWDAERDVTEGFYPNASRLECRPCASCDAWVYDMHYLCPECRDE
jgi:hypothetical protein